MDLSKEEMLDIFTGAACGIASGTGLWQKGADFCLQADVEAKEDPESNYNCEGSSYLRVYLHNTIQRQDAKYFGLDVQSIACMIDKGLRKGVLVNGEKEEFYSEIVMSDALLNKKDLEILLADDSMRSYIRKFDDPHAPTRGSEEKRQRALKRVDQYEREQIVCEGREYIEEKKKIRAVMDNKMTEAVYQGLLPPKDVIKKLVAEAKAKGLREEEVKGSLMTAKKVARQINQKKEDTLAVKQEKLEDAGFVRKIINRGRQK